MVKIPKRLPSSLKGLQEMVNYINSKYPTKELSILEIGSWVGVSTILFAKAFKQVIAIDPWSKTTGINTQYNMRQVEKEFDQRTIKYDNIIKRKMTSLQYKNKLLQKDKIDMLKNDLTEFDVIYIDGAHDYKNVSLDIKLWKDKAVKFICGHDYYNKFPGVKKAVNEVFSKPDMVFPDSSWLVEVK